MYWTRADRAGKAQLLMKTNASQFPGSVTADGKRLAYQELGFGTLDDIWTVPLESDSTGLKAGKPELFLQTPFDERHPAFSPDGRWLAYDSDESGPLQVYVRAFPDKGGKWRISITDGELPVWSRDGRELFFRNLEAAPAKPEEKTITAEMFLPNFPVRHSSEPLFWGLPLYGRATFPQ